jgi:hypothetical protein
MSVSIRRYDTDNTYTISVYVQNSKRVVFSFLVSFKILGHLIVKDRPPLWSSGQISWLQAQRSRIRLPELPDFLRSSGYETGCTQPRVYN